MKFVDSLVSGQKLRYGLNNFLEARVTVSQIEYANIERIFGQILGSQGSLKADQEKQFKQLKKILPRFRQDWRYKDLEKEAKNSLLEIYSNI